MNSFNFGSSLAYLKLNNKTRNERACLSILSNCSYTLQVTEQLLSLDEQSSQNKLTLKQENLLSNLVKQALATSDTHNELNETQKNVRTLYSYLFDEENSIKEFSSLVSLADIDVFHYLVSLTLLSNPNKLEQFYLFKLMLQLQALQIVLNYLIANKSTTHDGSSLFVNYLVERLKEKSFIHHQEEESSEQQRSIDLSKLVSSLKQALMPFLRCCVLFYWFLSNVTQSCEVSKYIADNLSDFTHMITSLGLTEPDFEDLVLNVNNPSLIYLIDR